MESFDYRKYIPLGLIALVLLLPVIVLLFSGSDAKDRADRPDSDTNQTDGQPADTTTAQPDAAQPDAAQPAIDYAKTEISPAVIDAIGVDPSPDRFPPPPYQIALIQTPPGYEALLAGTEVVEPAPPVEQVATTPSQPEPAEPTSSQPESSQPEPSQPEPQPEATVTVAEQKEMIGQLRTELLTQLKSDTADMKSQLDQAVQQLTETIKREIAAAVKAARADLQSSGVTQPQAQWQPATEQPAESPPATKTAENLPIDVAALKEYTEVEHFAVRNLISLEQLSEAIRSGDDGLRLNFEGITTLLDGTRIDPTKIYGTAYFGPYPFEAAETAFGYKRFRPVSDIRGGRATLDVGRLLRQKYNSEQWTDRGQLALRVVLWLEQPGPERPLGTYDTFTAFRKTNQSYEKCPWLVERPMVNRLTSDDPSRAVLSFKLDAKVPAVVMLDDGRQLTTPPRREHVVPITQIPAGGRLGYRIRVGQITSRPYSIEAPPAKGEGPVTFAYCGDSREGVGTGEAAMMGINYQTLHLHAARAYRRGARFFLFGGDLINGYTTSPADFRAQLAAWKQAMAGFSAERPVYPAMGNHEALLRVFKGPKGRRLMIDRWPYDSDSAEAVFAREFLNPENAPAPSDPRRPTYNESVFTFQYGLVRVIAFNNNYWYSDNPSKIGGSPEGYMFDDQLRWIERWLEDAERDPTVKYIVLYAQEPVFPCGGHVQDAMWHNGDNRVRAYTFRNGSLEGAPDGIVDVRNRFALAVSRSSKVAAVMCSDEHSYYRVLIDRRVPVGDPRRDDRDGNGVIDWDGSEPASTLDALPRPVWYLTSGGGGAPYYAEQDTPWTNYWAEQKQHRRDPRDGFFYSSQENLILFHATEDRISAEVINPYGERIDVIGDLMQGK